MSNIVGVDAGSDQVRVGMRLRVDFNRVDESVTLHEFRPASGFITWPKSFTRAPGRGLGPRQSARHAALAADRRRFTLLGGALPDRALQAPARFFRERIL